MVFNELYRRYFPKNIYKEDRWNLLKMHFSTVFLYLYEFVLKLSPKSSPIIWWSSRHQRYRIKSNREENGHSFDFADQQRTAVAACRHFRYRQHRQQTCSNPPEGMVQPKTETLQLGFPSYRAGFAAPLRVSPLHFTEELYVLPDSLQMPLSSASEIKLYLRFQKNRRSALWQNIKNII